MKRLLSVHLAAIGFAVGLVGCGGPQADYSSVELVDVSGTIKLDGTAVEGAVVVVQDLTTGNESYGLTDSSGEYRLQFDSVKNGIVPGEKKIIVSTTKKILGLNSEEEGGEEGEEGEEGEGESSQATELIPKAYRVDSKLRATVTSDTTRLDFNLAGDGSTTSPL